MGNLIEDFSKLSPEQRQQAPALDMPTRTLELGTIKKGTSVSGKLRIANKGKSKLEIRRVINNNKELSVSPSVATIASGKQSELKVNLNSKLLVPGEYKRYLSVQTNDPQNTFAMVIVTWTIQ